MTDAEREVPRFTRGRLPRLVLIADRFTVSERAERAVRAVRGGVRWIHLRDHEAARDRFNDGARVLVDRLRSVDPDVCISVNTYAEVARVLDTGLHVGRRGPSIEAVRDVLGPTRCIGYSAHDLESGREAVAAGANYLFYSPVFPTSSKPDHPGVGVDALGTFCEVVPDVPVLALGGITPPRTVSCLEAGAYGVAVLSGLMEAASPADAARTYLREIERFLTD